MVMHLSATLIAGLEFSLCIVDRVDVPIIRLRRMWICRVRHVGGRLASSATVPELNSDLANL